jgi:hypothetical protein
LTFEVSAPRSQQVTATMSQSIAAATNFDYAVPITIFASTCVAFVIGTNVLSGGTAGYPGVTVVLRPQSGTGRAATVQVASYPGAFCSSLIAQVSDAGIYGTLIRLNDAWIDNANSRLIFQFRNVGAGTTTATARITATVIP